jgi:hypothetical protein
VDRKAPGFESIDGFLAAAHDSPDKPVAKGATGKGSVLVEEKKADELPTASPGGSRAARALRRGQGKPRFSLPGAGEDSSLTSVGRRGIRVDMKATTFSPSELSAVSTAPPTPAAAAVNTLADGDFDSPLLTQDHSAYNDEDVRSETEENPEENPEENQDDAEEHKAEQDQSNLSAKNPNALNDSAAGTPHSGGQEMENTPRQNLQAGLPSPGDNEQMAFGNDVSDDDNDNDKDNEGGGFELADTNETPVRPQSAARDHGQQNDADNRSEEESEEEADPGPRNSSIANATDDNDNDAEKEEEEEEEEGEPKFVHDPETPESVREERIRNEEEKISKGRKKKASKKSKVDLNHSAQDSVTPEITEKKQRKKKVKINAPGGSGYPAGPREYSNLSIYDYVGDDANRKDVRRSKRARTQPLQYWKNERFLYGANKETGILGEAMGNMPVPTKIVVANETPYKVRKIKSGNKAKPKAKKPKTDDIDETPFNAGTIKRKYAYLDGEDAFVWNDGTAGPVEESESHRGEF